MAFNFGCSTEDQPTSTTKTEQVTRPPFGDGFSSRGGLFSNNFQSPHDNKPQLQQTGFTLGSGVLGQTQQPGSGLQAGPIFGGKAELGKRDSTRTLRGLETGVSQGEGLQQPTVGLFGSAQQRPMQFGGPIFGSAQQHSSGPIFGSTQQQFAGFGGQVGFGRELQTDVGRLSQPLGFGLGGGFRLGGPAGFAQLPSGGISNILKWVSASNGSVPDEAVEGGWCSQTQEPYYLARVVHSDGELYPGVVLKSQGLCFYSFNSINGLSIGSKINYEVLVNPNNDETLAWVPVHNRDGSFGGILPDNIFKVGYNSGHNICFGRRKSSTTGDIVPGRVNPNRGLTCIENNKVFVVAEIFGYEVLCLVGKGPRKLEKCIVYDIEYDQENPYIDWSQVKLDEAVLLNKSSVQQKLTPHFQIGCPMTFKWEVNGDKYSNIEVEIKGCVPYVFGGKGNEKVELGDYWNLPITRKLEGSYFSPFEQNESDKVCIHGGSFPVNLTGMRDREIQSSQKEGLFQPTVVAMKLNDTLRHERIIVSESSSFTVPARTQLTIEEQGHQVQLTLPFKAKTKLVYQNCLIEDDEISGTYEFTGIVAILPAIVDNKACY